MSGAQDDVQRAIDADNTRTGPPMAFQATGGAGWQHGDGWRYRPLNAAAVAQQHRHVAFLLQDLANGTAALGRGRGVAPERSGAMLAWSKLLAEWAGEMETEAAEP